MAQKPDDAETTRPSGSLVPGDDGRGSAATHDDAERTIVVPPKSRGDEEATVVVDRKPLFDDPERTLVAPTPVEPPGVKDAATADAGPRGTPPRSDSDEQDEQTLYQHPTVHQGARAPAGPAPAPPSPQRHPVPGSTPSVPPAGPPIPAPPGLAQQPGFGPQPLPYGQASPYGYPPAGPYAAPPYGPVAPAAGRRSTRSTALLWGGLGLAAVVLGTGLLIGLSNSEFVSTKKLDVQDAQSEIQRVLTDDVTGYGNKNVADVKCNNGENVTIKQGSSFTCQVSVDGASRRVTATFLDNNGNFEVGRPD